MTARAVGATPAARLAAGATKYLPFGPRHAKHGLVFLHGWKMNGSSMRSCVRAALGGSGLADTTVYFLTSPLTKDDDGETPEWFAYTSDDRLNFDAADLAREA